MKKLFKLTHSITIDEFTSLIIHGPYQLVKLEPTSTIIRCDGHIIHLQGEHLTVDRLEDEAAVFSCEAIQSVRIEQLSLRGVAYES